MTDLPLLFLTGTDCGMQFSLDPRRPMQEFAAVDELPWMVSLQDVYGNHLALGCILDKHWIVSAASTFLNRTQVSARVGITGLKHRSFLIPISAIIPHEAFDELTLHHDIALLKIGTRLYFSKALQPICFPPENFPVTALRNCLVAGWLHPYTVQAGSVSLRKLSVVDVDPCPLHRIMTTECCSHRKADNVSGCLGYPGNPVMCQADGTKQWVLKGVMTKGGTRCYGPFLYTRVSSYGNWIVTTTAKWGAPVSPIPGSRHSPFRPPMEEDKGIFEPIGEERAIDFSDHTSPNHTEHLTEDSQELPEGPAESRAKQSDPIYYDYYSGELLPVSTAKLGQPEGLLSASLMPCLLTCWMVAG
ncbi:inactive serine protease 54 [Lacerta agilis]|uniref:inactive serine protease 54 n=1 Tax=Lacerta agilis TaxID=80427 RepID=UPI00141A1198|nr:inactive serine protease 54 [Lacerta agilis]